MGFSLNEKKTKLLKDGVRQSVTGIVVNEKPQVSRDYRKKLRQEIYYCMKYGVTGHLERLREKTGNAVEEQVNPEDREFAEYCRIWKERFVK